MNKVVVGHVDRDKGVYVGLPSVFGNRWRVGQDGSRDEVIQKYAEHLDQEMADERSPLRLAVMQLVERVKNGEELVLCCFCAPKRCHGTVLAKRIELEANNFKKV